MCDYESSRQRQTKRGRYQIYFLLRLWDVASGQQLRILRGHESELISAQFSADGEPVLTAGDDKSARLWDCAECRSSDGVVLQVTRQLGRELTDVERQRFGVPLAVKNLELIRKLC